MLRSRIIPSLLVRNNGLVKTLKFGDGKYVGDPINAVRIFNEKQVDELCVFDIDATRDGREPNLNLISTLAHESRMPLCYGGGVTSAAQAATIISMGVEKVAVSAAAVERPQLVREIADEVGSQSAVVVIDVKKGGLLRSHYSVVTHNGTRKTKYGAIELAALVEEMGAGEIVINSVDRDGVMQGYDLDLAEQIRDATNIPMTMLGGAGSLQDMDALIERVGTVGAAAGSLFVFKGTYKAVLINYARPENADGRQSIAI